MFTVRATSEIKKLWTCQKCGRQFERQGQTHSCKPFELTKHFEGKPMGKMLYEDFKRELKKQIGVFKIESLACCIHFVSTFTFLAVKIFKDKIKVELSLSRKIKSGRIKQAVQMSAHRYLYFMDIFNKEDVDEELMEWIREARDKRTTLVAV